MVKLPESLETLLLYKYCFLFGIAVIDIHFENDNTIPKLSKVFNDNCIVRFYDELDPNCYIKVRQGKVIVKNVGKKDDLSSISKWVKKGKTKTVSKNLESHVRNFF